MDTLPSVIRTIVPIIVSALVTFGAKAGLDLDDTAVASIVGTVVAAAYYAVVRQLETKHSQSWGWLLGLAKSPTYSSGSGYVGDAPTGMAEVDETA